MAALQEFKELLKQAEGLETDVAELEKQKTTLNQDIVSLRAKHQFLERQIVEVGEQASTAQSDSQTALEAVKAEIVTTEVNRADIQSDIIKLTTERARLESELKTLQESQTEQLAGFNRDLQAKKAEIVNAETVQTNLQDNLIGLRDSIESDKQALTTYDELVDKKRTETEQAIQELEAGKQAVRQELLTMERQLAEVEQKYNTVLDSIQVEQGKLAGISTEHQEFIAYERRAKKALEARESALLEQERQLEVRIVTSRRRNGVLDNL